MPRAVLDSAVLVGAFLTPHGVSTLLLDQAVRGAFQLYLSEAILSETADVLLRRKRLRKHYVYTDPEVQEFCSLLRGVASLITDIPPLAGISRGPTDDRVIACALAARARFLVTRDKDLLALGVYQQAAMVSPEEFVHWLREQH